MAVTRGAKNKNDDGAENIDATLANAAIVSSPVKKRKRNSEPNRFCKQWLQKNHK